MPMKSTDKAFVLRLPIVLYEFFEQEAKKNKRSVNAEILIAMEDRQKKIEKESHDS
jgi:hypothetical protein